LAVAIFRDEALDLIKALGLSEEETIAVEIKFSAFVQQLVHDQNAIVAPMPAPIFDPAQVF
jgi:hypothetical protein